MMYKDVAKRIIASILTFTMIGTTPDWTVLATQTGNDTSVSVETEAAIDAVMPEETEQIVEAEIESVSVDAIGEEAIEASTEEAAAEEIAPEETVTEESIPEESVTEDTPIETVVVEENTVDTEVVEAENKIDISDWESNCTVSPANATYTGSVHSPTITVTDQNGDKLEENTDYEITYPEDMINAGQKKITISGKGDYEGNFFVWYGINPKSLKNAKVVGTIPNQTSSVLDNLDNAHIDGLEIAFEGEEPLVYSEDGINGDYKVELEKDSTDVNGNVYTATVVGLNNYNSYSLVIDQPIIIGGDIADSSTYQIKVNDGVVKTYQAGAPITLEVGDFAITYNGTPHISNIEIVGYKNNTQACEATSENPPTVTVRGTGTGTYALAGTVDVPFTINPKELSEIGTISKEDAIYYKTTDGIKPGSFILTYNYLGYSEKLVEGEHYDASYTNNTSATDEAQIIVKACENTNYTGTATYTYKIKQADINNMEYSIEEFDAATYTGEAFTPDTDLEITQNDVPLEKDIDYTIKYLDEDEKEVSEMIDAGQYTVVISGANNYFSEKKMSFEIQPASIAGASVELQAARYKFNGGYIKPNVQKVILSEKELTEGTDYEIDYSVFYGKDKYPLRTGEQKVPIVGKGNYTGTAYGGFIIYRSLTDLKDVEGAITVSDVTYAGSLVDPKVVIYDNMADNPYPNTGSESTEFTIVSTYTPSEGKGTVTITAKNHFYEDSCEIPFTINPGNLAKAVIEIAPDADLTFTGSPVKPELVVKYQSTTGIVKLTEGTDYTVAYEKSTDVLDSAKATITGKNGYFTGEKSIEFALEAKSLSKGLEDGTFTVTGGEIDALSLSAGNYPETLSIMDTNRTNTGEKAELNGGGSYKLVEGKDFTFGELIISEDGTEGTVEINGYQNYKDSISITFTINKVELAEGAVSAILPSEEKTKKYTGTYVTPMPKVVINDGGEEKELSYDDDEFYVISDGVNVGTGYKYTVCSDIYDIEYTPDDDTFSIIARDLEDEEVVVDPIPNQAYTGQEIEPEVTVRIGDVELKKSEYKVTYENNIDQDAVATVTIEPAGKNLTGKTTTTFNICKNIDDIYLKGYEPECMYAGPGGTTQFVTVWKGNTQLNGSKDYSIEFINHYNATVGPDGNSNGNGPAIIRVVGKGTYGGVKDFTYEITPRPIYKTYTVNPALAEGMDVEVESVRFTGGTPKPNVKITYTNEAGVEYVLEENVDYKLGTLTSTSVGDNTSLEIYAMGNFRMFGDDPHPKMAYPIKILPKKFANADGTEADDIIIEYPKEVEFEEDVNEYTLGSELKIYDISRAPDGTPQAPNENDCYQLKSTEYEVRYNNNQKPGTATFTITGRGDYADGVYTKGAFNIVADLGGVQVDMLKDYVYTGKPVKVEIKKVSVPGAELAYNTDYTYEVGPYAPTGDSELTDVGEYYVRIIGKGAYADSEPQQFLFNIVPKSIEDKDVKVTNVYESYSHKGDDICPEPWIEYNGIELKEEDFVCTYNRPCGEAKQTYTFTIEGRGNFTGTLTREYYVDENFNVNITLSQYEYEYTGELHEPTVTVEHVDDGVLEAGEHYNYEIIKNRNAGTAYVNVWGLPNENDKNSGYGGDAQATFTINPKSLDDAAIEIAAVEQVTYNREEHTPTTTVFWNKGDGNKVELHEGTDFEYSYENNIDASTADAKAKVIINGIGNYKDSKSIEFVINKKNITEEDVTVEEIANQVYSGTVVDPVPEVIWEDIPLVEGTEFKLTYENNTELTTDDSKAKMTIEGTGNYEGTIEKEFNIVPIPVRDMVFEYKADHLYTGKEITPKVTMYYQYPTGNYASDKYPAGDKVWQDEKNFTVEYKHTKEAGEKDSSIINITAIEEHYSGSTQCYYTIGRRPLSDATIIMDKIPNQVVGKDNEPAKPMPTLTFRPDASTTYTLVYGSDYKVDWSNNTAPGMTGTVTVTGNGNFTGTTSATFYIGMDIHSYIDDVSFGEVAEYIYNGKAQTPEVVVVSDTLVPNVDYEILYDGVKVDEIVDDSHATKAGIHKAAVAGIGEYGGIIELEYEIDKRDISKVEFRTPEGTAYTGSPVYPLIVGHDEAAITRLGEDESTAETTGDISMEGMWTNLNAFTTSYQGNHTDIGPVTVTITATEDANYYGTTTLQFNIEPKDLQSEDILSSTVENQTYTGSPIKPEMKITDGGRNVNGTAFIAGTDIDYYTLVEGLDYDITFTDNIYPGRVTMTITGKNHYKGTLAKQFDIGADLSSAVIAPIPPQTYTGQPICPELKVTIGEKELKANFDYTATYANNVERGTATVTISPVAGSMFTGSNTATFEIGRELSEATTEIKLVSDSFVYTGNAIMPKPAVIYAGTKLVEGVDYTLSYSNNINVGTATITITAAGTFEGAVAKTFTIARRSITRCAFENVYDLLYNGNATTQNVVVKDGNRTLVENKDYTVTYANNVGPGAASVILTGIGNYAAVKTVYYMINVRPMGKIKGKATSNKVIKISWEPVAGAQGYAIYNAKNDLIGKTTKTYFNHKKLKALKNYKYKVRPYCVNDGTTYYGAFSNTITVRTLAKAPTKVKVKAGDDQLTISWKKVKGVSGYVVYRSTKKSGKYKKVATLKKASKTSWTNTNLASGKRYYYKVRSYKTIKGKKIYSKYTSPKSAKTY